MRSLVSLIATLLAVCPAGSQQSARQPVFTFQEVMVPMRDGAHLQTVILTPVDRAGPLPILFRRTPYGVPDRAFDQVPPALKELVHDGYILVIQNLRGRFKSEGTFLLSSQVDLTDSQLDERDDRCL